MAIESMTGQCLCGAVRFRAQEVETHIHACHCEMCRRWSGGPLLVASVASVSFSGEENIKEFVSSEWATRGFCAVCGSNLFYRLDGPKNYLLTSGAFDDSAAFAMAGEIYIDKKPAFYDFAGDHPRQTGEEFMKAMGMTPE